MSAQRTPGPLRGFLGNGAWLVAVHTKKCARDRRRVTPGERARSLVPNHQEQFASAMRDRAAIAKAEATPAKCPPLPRAPFGSIA